MKCSQCDADMIEGAHFCNECGAALASAEARSGWFSGWKRENWKRGGLLAVLLVMLLGGGAVGAVCMLGADGGDEREASATLRATQTEDSVTLSPKDEVTNFLNEKARLMQEQDWASFYELTSSEYRRRCSLTELEAATTDLEPLRGYPLEFEDLAVTVEGGRAFATYRLLADGYTVFAPWEDAPDRFIKEGGVWRDDYDDGDFPTLCDQQYPLFAESDDLRTIRELIESAATQSGLGADLPIVIDSSVYIWPWPWTLRHQANIRYETLDNGFDLEPGSVVLVSVQNDRAMLPYRTLYNRPVPYVHLFSDMLAYFPISLYLDLPVPVESEERVQAPPIQQDAVTVVASSGSGRGQVSQPADMAIDSRGNLYVVDTLNQRIQVFALDGSVSVFGESGTGPGQFGDPSKEATDYDVPDGPWGVAVDAFGNIYVADTWNHRIQRFGPDYEVDLSFDIGGLFGPRDVAVLPDGDILVADTGNKRLILYSPTGELVRIIGQEGAGRGEFNEPTSVAVAMNGDIYVADYWNQRIQRFDSDLRYVSAIDMPSWGSSGITDRAYIAAFSDRYLLATDPFNGRVVVVDTERGESWAWRIRPEGIDSRPVGIAIDDRVERVYISDGLTSEVYSLPASELLRRP